MTQLKFRLGEGSGECFYYIGVHDDGNLVGLPEGDLAASLETLHAMAAEVKAPSTAMLRCSRVGILTLARTGIESTIPPIL